MTSRLALALALALPLPALAVELPPDLFTIELGPTFRGFQISNDAGLDASVSAVFLGFNMAVVTGDGALFTVQSDLLGGLAIDILDKTDPAATGARIFRFTTHVPAWDLTDELAAGIGWDIDWAGFWAPGYPDGGTIVEPEVTAGTGYISLGLSGDLFHVPAAADAFAHAWVTLGVLMDLNNKLDAEASFFVGPLLRAEAEYVWEFTDLIALHPKASLSWYGLDDIQRYSAEWSPTSAIEWTIWLGVGIELDFDDD